MNGGWQEAEWALKQGRQAEAETLFRDALDRYQHSLGRSHHNTLSLMNDLGMLFSRQRKFEAANVYYA